MTINIYLGIKSTLYILFAWRGFQVCFPFFLRGNIKQKYIKIGMPFSNLLSQLNFTVGKNYNFREKISLISINYYTLPSNE